MSNPRESRDILFIRHIQSTHRVFLTQVAAEEAEDGRKQLVYEETRSIEVSTDSYKATKFYREAVEPRGFEASIIYQQLDDNGESSHFGSYVRCTLVIFADTPTYTSIRDMMLTKSGDIQPDR